MWKREKKGSSRVTALLTHEAVTPYGGPDRQIQADAATEWWTELSGWLWVFIHMSFPPLCECKRFYWWWWLVALSYSTDLFPVCEPVWSLRSCSASGYSNYSALCFCFHNLYLYFCTCSWGCVLPEIIARWMWSDTMKNTNGNVVLNGQSKEENIFLLHLIKRQKSVIHDTWVHILATKDHQELVKFC